MERHATIEDGRYREHVRRGVELMILWAAEDAAVIDLDALEAETEVAS